MNRCLHRIICLILVPAVVSADPAIPAVFSSATPPSRQTTRSCPFLTQAITPRSVLATTGPNRIGRRVFLQIGAATAASSLLDPLSGLAAPESGTEQIKVNRAAAAKGHGNAYVEILENDAIGKLPNGGWILPETGPDPVSSPEAMDELVLDRDADVVGAYLGERVAVQHFLVAAAVDKNFTMVGDSAMRNPSISVLGDNLGIKNAILVTGVNSTKTFDRFQDAQTKDNPSLLRRFFDFIRGGAVISSKSIVKENLQAVAVAAAEQPITFARLEQQAIKKGRAARGKWMEPILIDLKEQSLAFTRQFRRRMETRHRVRASAENTNPAALQPDLGARQEPVLADSGLSDARNEAVLELGRSLLVPKDEKAPVIDPRWPDWPIDRGALESILGFPSRFPSPAPAMPAAEEFKRVLLERLRAKGTPESLTASMEALEDPLFEAGPLYWDAVMPDGKDKFPIPGPVGREAGAGPEEHPTLQEFLTAANETGIPADTPEEEALKLSVNESRERQTLLELDKKTKIQTSLLEVFNYPNLFSLLSKLGLNIPLENSETNLRIGSEDLAVQRLDVARENVKGNQLLDFQKVNERLHEALEKARASRDAIAEQAQQLTRAMRQLNANADAVVDLMTPMQRITELRFEYKVHLAEAYQAQLMRETFLSPWTERIKARLGDHYAAVIQRVHTFVVQKIGGNTKGILIAIMTIGCTLAMSALGSAHTFTSQMITGQPAQTLQEAVGQFTVDVTFGRYRTGHAENTVWGVARDILRAQNPQSHPTGKAIRELANQIIQKNGDIDPRHIQAATTHHPGTTLHLGQYDANVARQLSSHHPGTLTAIKHTAPPVHNSAVHVLQPTAVQPLPTPAAPVPAVPAAPNTSMPHLSPADHVTAVPSAPSIVDPSVHHSILANFMNWAHQSPEHLLLIAVGVLILAVITVMIIQRLRSSGNGGPYQAFKAPGSRWTSSLNGRIFRTPVWVIFPLLAISLFQHGSMYMPAFTATFANGAALHIARLNWSKAIVATVAGASLFSLIPPLRHGRGKLILGAVMAAGVTGMLIPLTWPFPWMVFVPVFLGSMGVLQFLIHSPLGRKRRWLLATIPLALLAFWPATRQSPKPVPEKIVLKQNAPSPSSPVSSDSSDKNHENEDMNYGVSIQPVRVPVTWAPPPGEEGTVSSVRQSADHIGRGKLVIAYDPLPEPTLKDLSDIRRRLRIILDHEVVSAHGLASAADHNPKALIHITTQSGSSSVDHEIRMKMAEIHELLNLYDEAEAISKTNDDSASPADGPGKAEAPFDEQELRYRLQMRGKELEILLKKREARNRRANQDIQIYSGNGIIPKGTQVLNNSVVMLFQRQMPGRLLQLRLTDKDALNLEASWNTAKDKTTLRLRSADNSIIEIPLSEIEAFVPPTDLTFDTKTEDFYGPTLNSLAGGLDPIVTVDFIVPGNLISLSDGDLGFEGIYLNGQRLQAEVGDRTVGSAYLTQAKSEVSTNPPYTYELGPLQEQLAAAQQLVSNYETLIADVEKYRRETPESDIALELIKKYRNALDAQRDVVSEIQARISAVQQNGTPPGPNVQARSAYLWSVHPFDHTYPNPAVDRLVVLGSQVTIEETFYDDEASFTIGEKVKTKSSALPDPVEFEVESRRSLATRESRYAYTAAATIPRAQAEKFFPPGIPRTRTLVQIQLKHQETIGESLQKVLRSFESSIKSMRNSLPRSSIGTRSGQSHLKILELVLALGLTAGFAMLQWYMDPSGHLQSLLSGYLLAVATHELGHGVEAWRQGRFALPWLNEEGITWREKNEHGYWENIRDQKIQRAGPALSERTLQISVVLLAIILFAPAAIGTSFISSSFLIATVIGSTVFRYADKDNEAPGNARASETPASGRSADDLPLRYKTLGTQTGSRTTRPADLDDHQLRELLASMEGTVLEYERYWYRGEKRTYLTFWQLLPSLWSTKLKLKPQMVLYRHYERYDGMTRWQAAMIHQEYLLKRKRQSAGAKAQIYLVVWAFIAMAIFFHFLSPYIGLLEFRTHLYDAILRGVAMVPYIEPVLRSRDVISILFVIIVGVPLIGNALKWWGELLSTGPYAWDYLRLKLQGRTSMAVTEFEKATGRNANDELEKIYKTTILHPDKKEHAHFIDQFHHLSREIAERAQTRLTTIMDESEKVPDFENTPIPEEALAFEVAFRIQIRRNRESQSPIHPKIPAELAEDEWHIEQLRKADPGFDNLPIPVQYRRFQMARIREAIALSTRYPVHTLMALRRSGTLQLLADIENMEHRGLILQILKALDERTPYLDPDAYGAQRAQERFGHVFEVLHYFFEGLRDPVTRQSIEQFWDGAVDASERATWDAFLEKIPVLMSRTLPDGTEKTEEEIASDENIIRNVAYALTLRRLKESEKETDELLQELRRLNPHPAEAILQDRYLRDEKGQPTTTVLQLQAAYMKYYDLISEIVGRFPQAALLDKRRIVVTVEDTLNLRQGIREFIQLLRLTKGDVYMVDAGATHGRFFKFLKKNILKRIPWRYHDRVTFMTLLGIDPSHWLKRDPTSIVISSATPLDWIILGQSVGFLAHVPSELLSTAAAFFMVRELGREKLEKIIESARAQLTDEFYTLDDKYKDLRKRSTPAAAEQELRDLDLVEKPGTGRWIWRMSVKTYRLVTTLRSHNQIDTMYKERARLEKAKDDALRQIYELNHIESELNAFEYFLGSIGVQTGRYTRGDGRALPIVPLAEVMNGRYTLNELFIVRPPVNIQPQKWHGRLFNGLLRQGT